MRGLKRNEKIGLGLLGVAIVADLWISAASSNTTSRPSISQMKPKPYGQMMNGSEPRRTMSDGEYMMSQQQFSPSGMTAMQEGTYSLAPRVEMSGTNSSN
ncbi:MAG: hypothetical protein M0Z45_03605 [Actinomycetota bacterium]|nr:hypothetical protein [Actinomycetota bacterium]